jgi:hypothetical protein
MGAMFRVNVRRTLDCPIDYQAHGFASFEARVLLDIEEPQALSNSLMEVTSLPTSSTMPQYSCPIGVGWAIGWMPRYGHRSEPHTHVAEILMMASLGFMIFGVSRSFRNAHLVVRKELLLA